MAQSTFLLLILGIVIAGLAVMLGINAYQDNRDKLFMDHLVNDTYEIAVDAQRWMRKPEFFGGGGDSCGNAECDWSRASIDAFGYNGDESGAYHTYFGIIELDGTSEPSTLIITATDSSLKNKVVVRVNGVHPDSVSAELDHDFGS